MGALLLLAGAVQGLVVLKGSVPLLLALLTADLLAVTVSCYEGCVVHYELLLKWSRRGESDPGPILTMDVYCHCTTEALFKLVSRAGIEPAGHPF